MNLEILCNAFNDCGNTYLGYARIIKVEMFDRGSLVEKGTDVFANSIIDLFVVAQAQSA